MPNAPTIHHGRGQPARGGSAVRGGTAVGGGVLHDNDDDDADMTP